MTFLLLALLALIAYLVFTIHVVRQDGHGRRTSSDLPRSHPRDLFEPQH